MKKITMLFATLILAAFSWQGVAQTTTLYLTSSGGSYSNEKWVEITTGPNGTGTILFAQGNGTYGDGAGFLTDAPFTVTDGTPYYISCYDKYADGWDGTTYEIRTAVTGGGILVADNGGTSPDDGTNGDASSAWETRTLERESDELFSYTPPSTMLYLTSSGGSYSNEKWVEITTGPNGTGTILFAQGNGTYGDGAGFLTDAPFTVTDGTPYYISCYDKYADGWDGTTYEIRTAVAGGGILVADNGGTSPNDGTNGDASSAWETRALERESDELFSYTPASCLAPGTLTATNITTTGADLGWTSTGALWDVELGTAGFTPTGTPTNTGVANPLNATALAANTSYEFYVRNDCSGSTSTWSGPFSFTTPCATFTLPWSEDMENAGTIPNCWTMAGGEPWLFDNTGGSNHIGNNGTLSGTTSSNNYFAWVDASGTSAPATLTSPYVDISSLTNPQISFYEISDNEGNDNAILDVQVYDGAQWIFVGTYTTNTAGWEKKEITLSALTFTGPAAVRFTFSEMVGSTDFYDDIAIDDVVFEEVPSCISPTALTATNITATSADLGWTSAGSLWDVEMGAAGFTPTGTPTNLGVANPLNVTSLTSSTSYDFYVRNDCGLSGSSTWSGPFSFTTAFACPAGAECASLPGDVSTDFSFTALGGASTCPGMLSVTIPTGNVIDSVTTFYDMTAGAGAYMSEQRSWLYSPTVGAGEAALSNGTGSAGGTVSYNRTGISFANTASGVVDFELHAGRTWGGAGCDNVYNKVDSGTWNIVVYHSLAPSCFAPTALTATNITATAADLGWTSTGTLWDVEIDTAGFTATGTPTNVGTTNPHNATSLTANTSYEFYVRNNCGGSLSAWSGPFAFTTSCSALTLPWSEDFENAGAIPSCWTMAGGEPWVFSTGVIGFAPGHVGNAGVISGTTVSGNYFAGVDASADDGAVTLTSPYVDISSLTNPQISFYEISDNEGSDNSILDVEVYDGAAWNTVGTYNTNTPGWEKKEITLSGLTFTGPAAVRFTFSEIVGTVAFQDDIAIDDVTFEEAPACTTPLALAVTNITTTSADLGWTSTAALWDIELGTAGFTPTGTPTNVGVANPHNATGLTVNTSYDFYVRADCGASGNSAWAGPISFTTNCNAVASFSQNFDSSTNIPSCWASDAIGGNASVAVITDVAYANSDSNSVRLRVFSALEHASIISPELSTLGAAYRLTFNAFNRNSSATALLVGTVDPSGTFTLFDSIMLTQIFGDTNVIVDFSSYTGSDTRLMVRSTSSDSSFAGGFYSDLHVDDMVWELIPACLSPTALGATNITSTTADLTWASTGTLWDIELDTAGFTPTGNPTTAGVATNPHSVTGLTSGVYYEFYIRADCGASGLSVWAGPYSFRATPDYCAGDHFYDNGGPTADYSNGSNDSTVICASTAGDIVTVTFNTFGLEAGFDYLTIYDGVGSAGTSFGQFDGNTIPGPFTATDSSGCLTFVFTSDGAVVDIGWDATITCANPPVGISEATNNLGLSIYPNPNNGVFTLNIKAKNVVVEIMNTQGQVVLTKNNVNTNEQIDLSNNAKGIYFVTVTSNEAVTTQKVIVQ